jgi:lipopolysaccharide biosynthesis glycosyltransferase
VIVAACTDRNYLELAGVMLRALTSVGDLAEAEVVVCGIGLHEADKLLLEASATRPITFIEVPDRLWKRLSKLRANRQFTPAVYGRLVLPDLLADRFGRMLYLDSDVVINGSLLELCDIDLRGQAIAAVPDGAGPGFVSWRNRALGRPQDAPYFNSGVLLIDLAEWRRQNLGSRAIAFATANPDRVEFVDQDALNWVVGSRWTPLNVKWNFHPPDDVSRAMFDKATIVHYTTAIKPDCEDCIHPARDIYLAYRGETPWAGRPLLSKWQRKLRRIKRYLSRVIGR